MVCLIKNERNDGPTPNVGGQVSFPSDKILLFILHCVNIRFLISSLLPGSPAGLNNRFQKFQDPVKFLPLLV